MSAPSATIPSRTELFLAFVKITLSGFGGTLPWTRRMFVEEKRWLTAAEYYMMLLLVLRDPRASTTLAEQELSRPRAALA